ncbi:hypothetical protein E4P38_19765 [Blastococcus sp. CT_GayMR16]|nr:hypothetical protein E4P38_19765 [Blastococcus sp. CT_GayMR16]
MDRWQLCQRHPRRDVRTISVHAHLLERAGDLESARSEYEKAARRTLNLPERRYLEHRAARLRVGGGTPSCARS